MKNKNYKILLSLIVIIGFAIRVILAVNRPMWLDEQFSLLFATQFDAKDLLFNFTQDVHPGGYYFLVKIFLNLTNSLFALRLMTVIIPQILGIIIISQTIKNKKISLLSTAILSVNPFLINLSWGLRSYGIIFLLTSISYSLINKLEKSFNKKYIYFLILTGLIGNSLHYSMYIFNFFVILYLLKISKVKKKSKKYLVLVACLMLLAAQFFVSNDPIKNQYKKTFNNVGWIAKPNLNNIPKIYLMELGFKETTSLDLIKKESPLVTGSTYLFLGLLVYWLIKNLREKGDLKRFTGFVALPHILILGTSLLLPFLSSKFSTNQFIPDISIFIPRIHLSFIVFFWILISKVLVRKWRTGNKKLKIFTLLMILVVSISWIKTIEKGDSYFIPTNEKQEYLKNILNKNNPSNTYIWPDWLIIEAINPGELDKITNIYEIKSTTKKIENILNKSEKTDCSQIDNINAYIYKPYYGKDLSKDRILKTMNECCRENESSKLFYSFKCS